MDHKAHHVTEFLDAVRSSFRFFNQSSTIECIQGIEQEVGIDLRFKKA